MLGFEPGPLEESVSDLNCRVISPVQVVELFDPFRGNTFSTMKENYQGSKMKITEKVIRRP